MSRDTFARTAVRRLVADVVATLRGVEKDDGEFIHGCRHFLNLRVQLDGFPPGRPRGTSIETSNQRTLPASAWQVELEPRC